MRVRARRGRCASRPSMPDALAHNPQARAYFGAILMALGDARQPGARRGAERSTQVDHALAIGQAVQAAVAEHSLSPQSIEVAIRKEPADPALRHARPGQGGRGDRPCAPDHARRPERRRMRTRPAQLPLRRRADPLSGPRRSSRRARRSASRSTSSPTARGGRCAARASDAAVQAAVRRRGALDQRPGRRDPRAPRACAAARACERRVAALPRPALPAQGGHRSEGPVHGSVRMRGGRIEVGRCASAMPARCARRSTPGTACPRGRGAGRAPRSPSRLAGAWVRTARRRCSCAR